MIVDRSSFFDRVRTSLFGGRLGAAQVAGIERILDRFEADWPDGDPRFLAYILATAHHETGRAMVAVEENLNYSAARLRAVFPRRFSVAEAAAYQHRPERIANRVYGGRLGNGPEASGDGWRFRGRGLVQITGRANYATYGIVERLEAAMEPDTAARILIDGMVHGRFTGMRLADRFTATGSDWVGARRIVNGLDCAEAIAGYGRLYRDAL
ncbi:hypothetical protein [Ensifer soli]|uniref:hypothetical protein n=1 Tax=Ciceribacter sp. sgz301302 TaxID=3342379 RepID=UPI0035B71910